jgi:hypothetical protein
MNYLWVIEWKRADGEWECYKTDTDYTRKDVREIIKRWNASGVRKYRVRMYVRLEVKPCQPK